MLSSIFPCKNEDHLGKLNAIAKQSIFSLSVYISIQDKISQNFRVRGVIKGEKSFYLPTPYNRWLGPHWMNKEWFTPFVLNYILFNSIFDFECHTYYKWLFVAKLSKTGNYLKEKELQSVVEISR